MASQCSEDDAESELMGMGVRAKLMVAIVRCQWEILRAEKTKKMHVFKKYGSREG